MIHHVNTYYIPDQKVPVELPFVTTVILHNILPGATLSSDQRDAMLNIAIEQDIRQLNPGGLTGAMVAVAGAAINNCSLIEIQLSDYIIRELVENPVFSLTMYAVPKTEEDILEVIDDGTDSVYPPNPTTPWPEGYNPAYKHPQGWFTHHLSFVYNSISFFASYFSLMWARKNSGFSPTHAEIEENWKKKIPLFWMLFYIYFTERIRIFQYFIPVPCLAYGFGVYFKFELEGVFGPVNQIDTDSEREVEAKPFTNYQTIYTKYASHTCFMSTLGEEISQAFVLKGTDPLEYFINKISDQTNILKTYDDGTSVINITVGDMFEEIQDLYNTCPGLNVTWLWNKDSNDNTILSDGILGEESIPLYYDYSAFINVADTMWANIRQNMMNIFEYSSQPAKSIACLEYKKDTGVYGEVPHDILLYDTFGNSRIFKRGIRPPYPDNHSDHLFWDLTAAGTPANLTNESMAENQSQLFPDGMKFLSVEEAITYHVMNCCPYYVSLNRLTCSQGAGGFSVWGKGPIYTATLTNKIPGMYYKHRVEVILNRLITVIADNLDKDDDHYDITNKTQWIDGFK